MRSSSEDVDYTCTCVVCQAIAAGGRNQIQEGVSRDDHEDEVVDDITKLTGVG